MMFILSQPQGVQSNIIIYLCVYSSEGKFDLHYAQNISIFSTMWNSMGDMAFSVMLRF